MALVTVIHVVVVAYDPDTDKWITTYENTVTQIQSLAIAYPRIVPPGHTVQPDNLQTSVVAEYVRPGHSIVLDNLTVCVQVADGPKVCGIATNTKTLRVSIPNGHGRLNITRADNSTTQMTNGQNLYVPIGELITVSPVADSGYTLRGWQIDGSPIITESSLLLMDADHVVTIDISGDIPPPPLLEECIFPELSWNLIEVLKKLIKWVVCHIKQIITLSVYLVYRLYDVVVYILNLPDHLDKWVSRLFGIDPALPFFDELMKKIDAWISNKLGVDKDKPLINEVMKKVWGIITEGAEDAFIEGKKRNQQ